MKYKVVIFYHLDSTKSDLKPHWEPCLRPEDKPIIPRQRQPASGSAEEVFSSSEWEPEVGEAHGAPKQWARYMHWLEAYTHKANPLLQKCKYTSVMKSRVHLILFYVLTAILMSEIMTL